MLCFLCIVSLINFLTERRSQNAKSGGFCALIIWDCQLDTQTWLILHKGRGKFSSHLIQSCCRAAVALSHHFSGAATFACTLPWSAFILHAVKAHTLDVLWGWSDFCFYCSSLFSQDDKMFFLNNGRTLWIPRKALEYILKTKQSII